jgi:cell volume regulation protein A
MRDSDPGGVVRRVVSAGSPAAGRALRDLPLGERTWVAAISRDGRLMPLGGETVLKEGDDVELVLDVSDVDRLDELFSEGREERQPGRGERGERG